MFMPGTRAGAREG